MFVIIYSMKRKVLIVAVIVAGLAILAAGYYIIVIKKNSNQTDNNTISPVSSVCNDSIIANAAAAISSYDTEKLSAITTEVKKKTDYDRDVNCQYIVARYTIAAGQKKEAKESVARIKLLLSNGATYSGAFAASVVSESDLEMFAESIPDNQGSGLVMPTESTSE